MIQEEKRDHRKEENDPYKIKKKPKPFAPESSLMYYMTKAGWVIILNNDFLPAGVYHRDSRHFVLLCNDEKHTEGPELSASGILVFF